MIRKIIFLSIFICLAFSVFAQNKEDARELYLAGNYSRSIEICLEELKDNPSRDTSYIVLGWGLIKQKRFQEVVDYMSQGLKYVGAQNIWIVKNLAEGYFYLGRNDEALARFEQFVKSEAATSSKADCYYYMGEVYIAKNEFINADMAITLACYYKNQNSFWWTRLGYAREQQKAYQAALDAYSQAIKINQNSEEAQRGRDRVRVNLEQ